MKILEYILMEDRKNVINEKHSEKAFNEDLHPILIAYFNIGFISDFIAYFSKIILRID